MHMSSITYNYFNFGSRSAETLDDWKQSILSTPLMSLLRALVLRKQDAHMAYQSTEVVKCRTASKFADILHQSQSAAICYLICAVTQSEAQRLPLLEMLPTDGN